MSLPVYTFPFRFYSTAPELEIHYSIEPADPSVGIVGGAIDSWAAVDVYGRELKPEHFSRLDRQFITTAIHADYASLVEANQADIAAHAFDTKDN